MNQRGDIIAFTLEKCRGDAGVGGMLEEQSWRLDTSELAVQDPGVGLSGPKPKQDGCGAGSPAWPPREAPGYSTGVPTLVQADVVREEDQKEPWVRRGPRAAWAEAHGGGGCASERASGECHPLRLREGLGKGRD